MTSYKLQSDFKVKNACTQTFDKQRGNDSIDDEETAKAEETMT